MLDSMPPPLPKQYEWCYRILTSIFCSTNNISEARRVLCQKLRDITYAGYFRAPSRTWKRCRRWW